MLWHSNFTPIYVSFNEAGISSSDTIKKRHHLKAQCTQNHSNLTATRGVTHIGPVAMWDVAWTDPERELVGDHRGIKDSDRSDKEKSSSRNSISTTSSKASGHSALSRLRARALRHSSSLKEPNRPNVYTSSEPWTPNSSSNNLYPPNMLDTAADQTSALLMLNGGDMNPDAELGNVTHSTLPNGHSATTNMKSKGE